MNASEVLSAQGQAGYSWLDEDVLCGNLADTMADTEDDWLPQLELLLLGSPL